MELKREKLIEKKPGETLKLAVKRMLPGGVLAKKQLTKLKIYKDENFLNTAQKIKDINFSSLNKKNTRSN